MEKAFITGIIPGVEKDVIFSSLKNSFEFCFMTDSIYITGLKNKYIDYFSILDVQLNLKHKKNEIYVLSTFPLLVIDYNLDKTMEILKMKLKDNFIEIDN